MRIRTLCVLTLISLTTACKREMQPTPHAAKQTLHMLCGAGIRPAMEALKRDFEATEACEVRVTYAGSGTLHGSLQAGVQADLYLPGDIWYIQKARAEGRVDSHATVAWFVPVIAVRKGNPKGITSIKDLAREDLALGLGKVDACAIGNVTRTLFETAGIADRVKPDYEALTVNRLANQLKLDALDAVIVWDATARQYPDVLDTVSIDDADFHAVPLAVGILKQTAKRSLCERFLAFASGTAGAECFRSNAYQVPGPAMRIACGSSMRPAIEELAALFEKDTGRKTLRDYGSSGTVLLQVEESKQGDIYICHDPFAYTCEEKGISKAWHTIAYMEPALTVQQGNPKEVKGLRDLLRDDLRLGLPERSHSTRGKILWAVFDKAGMSEAMGKRKFFESRTHDLINQLKLGTVDIAVLWNAPVRVMPEFEEIPIEKEFKVDAITSATTGRTFSMERVKVTTVRLGFSKEPLLAAQFCKLCLSDKGRAILSKHGFDLP